MTNRTGKRVGPATIERRRAKITSEIAALGLPLPGSLVERRTRCGNTGCKCHGDPPQLHGPYLTWTRKVDNKTVTRTLDPAQAERLRPLLDNSRRLRELVSEFEALALRQVENDPAQPNPCPAYLRALLWIKRAISVCGLARILLVSCVIASQHLARRGGGSRARADSLRTPEVRGSTRCP